MSNKFESRIALKDQWILRQLAEVKASLTRYGYELELDETSELFALMVLDERMEFYVACEEIDQVTAELEITGHSVRQKRDSVVVEGLKLIAAKDGKKYMCGLIFSLGGTRSNPSLAFRQEFSWVMPPQKRLLFLIDQWSQPTHEAMSRISLPEILDSKKGFLTKQSVLDAVLHYRLEGLFLQECVAVMNRLYASFEQKIDSIDTNYALHKNYVHGGSVQGVLEENKLLVPEIVEKLMRAIITSIKVDKQGFFTIRELRKINFESIRLLFRELGFAANGSLGSTGRFFTSDMISTREENDQYLFELSSVWYQHVKEVGESKQQKYEQFLEIYKALQPYNNRVMFNQTSLGFRMGKSGLCPVAVEAEGLPHTYDLIIKAVELLKDRVLELAESETEI